MNNILRKRRQEVELEINNLATREEIQVKLNSVIKVRKNTKKLKRRSMRKIIRPSSY